MNLIRGLPMLKTLDEAKSLAISFISRGGLPEKAFRDAAHVATATVHGLDYLVTWNCKHLANGRIIKKLQEVCEDMGYEAPIICTPYELSEVNRDE